MASVAQMSIITVLPRRRGGTRPHMLSSIPHLQVDQLPPAGVMEDLIQATLAIPQVCAKESRMASPQTVALYLAYEYAAGPAAAFIDAHEFCHLHPLPEGTIHLTLPPVLGEEVSRWGWGERHPLAVSGMLRTLMTVYGPRDRHETEAVLRLVKLSCEFARGKLRSLEYSLDCEPGRLRATW